MDGSEAGADLDQYGRGGLPSTGQPSDFDIDLSIFTLTAERVRQALGLYEGESEETVERITNAVLGIGLDELPLKDCTMLVQYRVTIWQHKKGEGVRPAIFDRCYPTDQGEEKVRRQGWKDVRWALTHLQD